MHSLIIGFLMVWLKCYLDIDVVVDCKSGFLDEFHFEMLTKRNLLHDFLGWLMYDPCNGNNYTQLSSKIVLLINVNMLHSASL